MNINEALGLVVKEQIDELNIAKEVFAKRVGISRAGLYVIIDGSSSTTLDTICMLANTLNITPSSLVSKAQKKLKENE